MDGCLHPQTEQGPIPLKNPYFGRSAGPLAPPVADVALGMHAVARLDERDYTSVPDADIDWLDLDTDVRRRRIAVHLDPGAGMPVDPEARAAALRVADTFADAGAEVVELPAFINDGIRRDIGIQISERRFADPETSQLTAWNEGGDRWTRCRCSRAKQIRGD